MNHKSNLLKFQGITNGDMSGSLTSPVTCIHYLDNMGVQLNFTGTPSGTFFVEVSIDYNRDLNGNVLDAGNWVPITLPTLPIASGAPGSIYIDLNQLSASHIRVRYVPTSGTGSLNYFLTGKMV